MSKQIESAFTQWCFVILVRCIGGVSLRVYNVFEQYHYYPTCLLEKGVALNSNKPESFLHKKASCKDKLKPDQCYWRKQFLLKWVVLFWRIFEKNVVFIFPRKKTGLFI